MANPQNDTEPRTPHLPRQPAQSLSRAKQKNNSVVRSGPVLPPAAAAPYTSSITEVTSNDAQKQEEYVLLCVRQQSYVTRLVHDSILEKQTDQDIFRSFREVYYSRKYVLLRWLSLRCLKWIEFTGVGLTETSLPTLYLYTYCFFHVTDIAPDLHNNTLSLVSTLLWRPRLYSQK